MKKTGWTLLIQLCLLGALLLLWTGSLWAQPPAGPNKDLGNMQFTRELEMTSVIQGLSRRYSKIIFPEPDTISRLKGKISYIVFPDEEASKTSTDWNLWYHIYESALAQHGYTMVDGGEVVRLLPIKEAQKIPLPIEGSDGVTKLDPYSERILIQIIRLKYITVKDTRHFWPKISSVANPIPLDDQKTLIITGTESMIKHFLDLLAFIDIETEAPYGKNYKIKHANVNDVKNKITGYFNIIKAREGAAPRPEQSFFMLPDERQNTLYVNAVREYHKITEEMIELLDKPLEDFVAWQPIRIVKLSNSDPKTVADKLNLILKPKLDSSRPPNSPQQQTDQPTIVPFEELNSLIISVDKEETFKAIEVVIKELDVRRKQVYLASTIVEVNTNSDFNLGVEMGAAVNPASAPSKFGGIAASGFGLSETVVDVTNAGMPVSRQPIMPSGGLALSMAYKGYDLIPMVLQASKTDGNINILAYQVIICDDNEKALIEISEERAFTTSSQSSGSTVTSFGGFNKAGISLDITPTISSDDFLKLQINQNVDRFIPDTTGQNRDVRTTRKATTTVSVPNRTSVVIGGSAQKQSSRDNTKVPLLGDIPLLGHMFKRQGRSDQDNSLFLFITPTIISEFVEMEKISDRFHTEISHHPGMRYRKEKMYTDTLNSSRRDSELYEESLPKKDALIKDLGLLFSRDSVRLWLKEESRDELSQKLKAWKGEDDYYLPMLMEDFSQARVGKDTHEVLLSLHYQLEDLHPVIRVEVLDSLRNQLLSHLAPEKETSEDRTPAASRSRSFWK